MDTREIVTTRRHERGAVRPIAIAIAAILAALVAAAWLLIVRPYQEQMQLDAGGAPAVQAAVAKGQAAAPANLQAMDVSQLLDEASKALKEQRLLAPSGNNAYEFYLRVLAKQPGNPVATSALRETFPYAAADAEQSINGRDFNEAQREIDLLAKADKDNYTLTILRSKLDAQRKLLDQQQQQALDQQKAAQLAAQRAAADKAAATKLAEQQAVQLAAEQAKARQQVEQQRQPAAQAPAATPATAAAGGETYDAVLLKRANPNYPTAALRAGRTGWVVVGFTVTPDGRTEDVRVVDSQPRHVFDRAAIEAVSRYRFKPAMRNGTPVASVKQQKIEFSTNR